MNTRFYNCKILTLCKDDEILKNCELWVEGNKIAYIGKPKESPISFDREIDCNGNLVMPSFKNGHGHGIMTFCRSIADDLPLDKWLNEYELKLKGTDSFGNPVSFEGAGV